MIAQKRKSCQRNAFNEMKLFIFLPFDVNAQNCPYAINLQCN